MINIKYAKYLLSLSIGAFSAVVVGLLSLNLTPPTDNSQAATSTFATGPATVSISTSPEAVAFGGVSGGSATKTQAVTVTTTSVAGYTLSQNFGDSATTQTSATSGTTTAKWVTSGALTKNGGTATIPVALSHSFNVANEDQHDFTYSVTVTDAQHMPSGVYSGKLVYTAVAKLPSAPTLTSATPTEFAVGSVSGNLTLTGTNLDSVYQVYLGDVNDASTRCDIDTSVTRTTTTLACKAPTELTEGEHAIHLVYQGGEVETTTKVSYIKKSICTNAAPGSECTVDIDANMIPVKYAGDPNGDVTPKWVVADTTKKGDWYDYSAKQWANAVTVKADALAKYKGATPGATVIDNDDVLGYFVYIPRYAYEVQRRDATDKFVSDSGNSGFDIHFETTSTPKSTPAVGCSTLSGSTLTAKDYRTECGINRTYHGGTTTDGVYAATTWATHPAFTWGKAELNGFWMGKFETTGKISAPTIKPNQVANISNTIGEQFTSAASIGVDDPTADTMGSTVSNITKNGHNLRVATSHMLKNSEWGAAAYLSASNYGAEVNNVKKNGVRNSNYSTDADGDSAYSYGGAATGCGPSSATSDDYASQQSGIILDATTIENDGICETSSTDTTHAYNQSLGVLASTTNNVYGVYDMAGGMWEYVMGNRTTAAGQSTSNASYVANPVKVPYLDLYNTSDGFGTKPSWSSGSDEEYYNNDVCTWSTCGGQALHETKAVQSVSSYNSSWGSGYSRFVSGYNPWFERSGRASINSITGVFFSSSLDGDAWTGGGFRVGLRLSASAEDGDSF